VEIYDGAGMKRSEAVVEGRSDRLLADVRVLDFGRVFAGAHAGWPNEWRPYFRVRKYELEPTRF
jgi:hypothetical protein